MNYEILDTKSKVINTIIAEQDFVETHYPGKYKDVTPKPMPEIKTAPIKTLEEKIDELMVKIDVLIMKG